MADKKIVRGVTVKMTGRTEVLVPYGTVGTALGPPSSSGMVPVQFPGWRAKVKITELEIVT